MPLVRRKKVALHPSPEGLEHNPDVYYLERTGEIFLDYEAYAARMSFYKMKAFQCEVTGKGGLDYFQALDSERAEARTLHARFPESLKAPILKSVQWRKSFTRFHFLPCYSMALTLGSLALFCFYRRHVIEIMGRLDHLVELVYERFKDRYFPGERMTFLYDLFMC